MGSEEDVCKELIDAFPGCSWKWDERFDAVLVEFKVADQAKIHDVLRRLFSCMWDRSNIDTAPDTVQAIKKHIAGLLPGQIIFTSDPALEDLIFCAWWPWGNGQIISLRVAPFSRTSVGSERIKQVKTLFGI